MSRVFFGGIFFIILFVATDGAIRFASMFGDHMVLQRAPKRAAVWGYADVIGDHVTVRKNGVLMGETTVVSSNANNSIGTWKLHLLPESHPGPYSIIVTSSEGRVTIKDVKFGDVWLCSGQGNMQFEMKKIIDSQQEINDAMKYHDIRMLFTLQEPEDAPQSDAKLRFPWTRPVKGIIDEFSAVCFLYARELQRTLKYPIGLILSCWGGTAIEVWSPPEALTHCPLGNTVYNTSSLLWPTEPSVLWNSMINPYTPMTIMGAIWYQGEANSRQPDLYACQFPAMINSWRNIFHTQSDGQTDDHFPFGFVQLAPYRSEDSISGFPLLRWAQTHKFGYNPNAQMPNTFMAVAIDLPDFGSPYGSLHPRYKSQIAERLSLGGLSVAYGNQSVVFKGPFPTHAVLDDRQHLLTIAFDNGEARLKQYNTQGFEVCCAGNPTDDCKMHDTWVAAPITSGASSAYTRQLDTSGCHGGHVAGVRYLWRESPCHLLQCALYSQDSSLPVPPFIHTGGFNSRLVVGGYGGGYGGLFGSGGFGVY